MRQSKHLPSPPIMPPKSVSRSKQEGAAAAAASATDGGGGGGGGELLIEDHMPTVRAEEMPLTTVDMKDVYTPPAVLVRGCVAPIKTIAEQERFVTCVPCNIQVRFRLHDIHGSSKSFMAWMYGTYDAFHVQCPQCLERLPVLNLPDSVRKRVA